MENRRRAGNVYYSLTFAGAYFPISLGKIKKKRRETKGREIRKGSNFKRSKSDGKEEPNRRSSSTLSSDSLWKKRPPEKGEVKERLESYLTQSPRVEKKRR